MKADSRTLVLLLCLGLPALAAPEPVNRYALVIGITGYPNFRADDRLQYADSDAKLFATFLESDASGGFPRDHIRVLLNEKATRTNIYKEIEWIGSHAYTNDVVYIYFAGHGVLDSSDRAYFMPYDGDPSVPDAEGLRANDFMLTLREKISARQEIFFVDACHAGAAYSPDGAARRDAGNIVPELRALWQAQSPSAAQLNMAFLSAASNQFSLEDDTYRHGVFTYFLVDGLSGKADANHDGKVTAEELRNYVGENVEGYAQRKRSVQTPTVSPAFDPSVVLSIYSTGSIARSVVQGPPPAPNAAPGKLSVASRTAALDFSMKASQRPVAARVNQARFDFDIWLDIAASGRNQVASVAYDFVLADNPLHFDSTQPGNNFMVSYNGWGCYSNVQVTVTLLNGTKLPPRQFNMCESLGMGVK